jgi:exopolysaccharide production protein ExoQ
MPPPFATLICFVLIFYLFWIDQKSGQNKSHAIWIPFAWMVLAGSRSLSFWLNQGSNDISAEAYLEGSPLNRSVFIILIISGIIILVKRKLKWSELYHMNKWVWLFFIFGAISLIWSDFPLVAFKRWFKALGNVIMALIILTEKRPYIAFGTIIRRFAYFAVLLSVLLIKYYPELGREYTRGFPMYSGIAGQKNQLGNLCLISGVYISWQILYKYKEEIKSVRTIQKLFYLVIIAMIVWLLYLSSSATSTACMIIALTLCFVARQPSVACKPHRIMKIFIICLSIAGICELVFGLKETVVTMMGRRPDLTTRVPMWNDLLSIVRNPFIGFGFESFWLGNRRIVMQEHWGNLIQAHNGYLQVFLDLGYIGLTFVIMWIISGFIKIYHNLSIDYSVAVLRFCFIIIVALYNYTEATLFGASNMWLILCIGIMNVPSTNELLAKQ